MASPKLRFALALALPVAVAHAAATEHHTDTANTAAATTVLVASVEEPTIPVIVVAPAGEHTKPASSGIAESLPETPAAIAVAPLQFNVNQTAHMARTSQKPARVSVGNVELPDEPGMLSLVEASPIGGAARRIQAQRFNTDDGVSDDFAICYRFNNRSSLQVIPGDPAPVKIPVSSFANNAGITIGMVVRLSRHN